MPTLPNGSFKRDPLKPILDTVVKTVTDHHMFRAGNRVLVAVSGGPDSVALVSILSKLAPRLFITLGVAHLNHGLRPEAEDEARCVKALAKKLALPFYLESRDVAAYRHRHGLSLEEAGREVRYAFYRKVLAAERYQKIATGHHRDDNAEMVLMNLLRGSGPLGLSGIPPVRENVIVRPLINLARAHIHAYLDHRRLDYVSDPSNADTCYTRNRIRHTLLPLIQKEFNANILDALHRTALITGAENQWLESIVDPLCETILTHPDEHQVDLDTTAFDRLARAPARRVIRRAIALLRGNLRRVTFAHIEALVRLAKTGNEHARVDLPGLICAVKKKDRLILKRMARPRQSLAPEPPPKDYRFQIETHQLAGLESVNLEIAATGGRVIFQRRNAYGNPEIRGSGQQTALFDIDQLSFPLLIRNYQPGDRLTPLGMRGSKKLKKIFNERS
ncbi:MAG: tRNA lysidine(34) synthetase TilS, partial [Desulfobacterales bacterium]|nr:tRNA lysidine(34) synthetase TilS [Desulfobacterales bacterium]